jgi:hypothetical protein
MRNLLLSNEIDFDRRRVLGQMTIWNIMQQNYSTATNVDSRDTLSYQADSFVNRRCGMFYFQYPILKSQDPFLAFVPGFVVGSLPLGRYFVASG